MVAELVRANELQMKTEQLKTHRRVGCQLAHKKLVRWYRQQPQAGNWLVVIENNVTDFIGKAKVTDKSVSFDRADGANKQRVADHR
jgi:hypothetical protein